MKTIPVFLHFNNSSGSDEFPAEMKRNGEHGIRFLYGFLITIQRQSVSETYLSSTIGTSHFSVSHTMFSLSSIIALFSSTRSRKLNFFYFLMRQ
ncbi:hypothetical protein QQF64_017841 [Cirrhinus molitorella]|uniref:Uncharacterized protein n=1 Tax=Cirrhinus molitorella TaxID=172907 RepID=A0ABR3LJU5_9TELE